MYDKICVTKKKVRSMQVTPRALIIHWSPSLVYSDSVLGHLGVAAVSWTVVSVVS